MFSLVRKRQSRTRLTHEHIERRMRIQNNRSGTGYLQITQATTATNTSLGQTPVF
jgi:hypothetical protein